MRKVIVLEFITLDGVIQAGGGPEEDTSGGFAYGGWEVPYGDDVVGAAIKRTSEQARSQPEVMRRSRVEPPKAGST